jgi:hypothetical protein
MKYIHSLALDHTHTYTLVSLQVKVQASHTYEQTHRHMHAYTHAHPDSPYKIKHIKNKTGSASYTHKHVIWTSKTTKHDQQTYTDITWLHTQVKLTKIAYAYLHIQMHFNIKTSPYDFEIKATRTPAHAFGRLLVISNLAKYVRHRHPAKYWETKTHSR